MDDRAARSWRRAARPDTMEWWGIAPRRATGASPHDDHPRKVLPYAARLRFLQSSHPPPVARRRAGRGNAALAALEPRPAAVAGHRALRRGVSVWHRAVPPPPRAAAGERLARDGVRRGNDHLRAGAGLAAGRDQRR